ncbi:hypothetical protein JNB63_14135 [Microbacterium trichothecenolyticum]|uniref:three-helix bundle dimerization domain-containing protein n=1 Tax=Microbacterium trichothecenolyticum TaxID=69370 RepID=UPI001C6ECE92|nr:hypothetical protein [Microbacterium trichothecenolyticum]MBW9121234.1 hypothetical protein [Microbacterium trichothecenolyticum]
MADKGIDEDTAFREITERITEKHPEAPAERIAAVVDEVRAEMSAAKVRDFVPVLAEREVKSRLKHEFK